MQSNTAQELLGTQVSQAMRFADLPPMSVVSEPELQEANVMRDPSLHLRQTTEQSSYTSTEVSRPEAARNFDHDSSEDAQKSNRKDDGLAIVSGKP